MGGGVGGIGRSGERETIIRTYSMGEKLVTIKENDKKK